MKKIILLPVIFLLFKTCAFSQYTKGSGEHSRVIDSLQLIFKNTRHDTTRARLYLLIGDQFSNTSADSTFFYYEKALSLAKKTNSKSLQAQILRYIGIVYKSQSNFKTALEYYYKALELSIELSNSPDKIVSMANKKGVCACYINIGNVNSAVGNYSQAIELYQKSLKIYEEFSHSSDKATALFGKNGVGRCLNDIGLIYAYQANYTKALDFYQQSLKIREESNNKKGIAECFNNIGILYNDQSNYAQAVSYYTKSLNIRKEVGDKKGMAECYLNIGAAIREGRDFPLALANYQKALTIFNDIGDKQKISYCYLNMGISYKEQGIFSKAFEYYQKSLVVIKELDDKNAEAIIEINIAEINIELKQYSDAIEHAIVSKIITKEIGALNSEMESYRILSAANDSLGNSKEALKYFKLCSAIKDSIFNKEKAKAITEMEAKYQSEKKQKDIVSLTKEKQIQSMALEKNRNLTIFILIVASLILVLLIILFSLYKIKLKNALLLENKNNELELLNKKLTTSESELIKLNSSKDKFFSIISHDLKNPLSAFKSITKFLSSSFYSINEQDKYTYICDLNNASEQLNNLTQNLLQWAVSQTGIIKFNPMELDLSVLVFKAVMLQKPKAEEKEINLVSKINENTFVFCDSNMLSTVLINLISNAIKFTEKYGIVTVSAMKKNEFTIVSVNDTGIGISPVDIDSLFKIETDHKTIGDSLDKGTGLGLILCKEFVEKNGGKIWAESIIGKGSTFYFTVPNNNLLVVR